MKKGFGKQIALGASILAVFCMAGCTKQVEETVSETGVTVEITTEQVSEETEDVETNAEEKEMDSALAGRDLLDYAGYTLVWEDNFDAEKLDETAWNYELHDPGWVNNELQAYIQSDETVYIKDGKLVIKPIEKEENGKKTYVSGRVNTQGKHDFTYGIIEANIKMPAGKGFLPAFWMMPTDENLYGQWPRCGEIDISEILGDQTKTAYGTVHYGNPHAESQGTVTLNEGDFTTEFHKYAVEWLPGRLNWYIDGALIHTENDWYTATENVGTVTYPAPFDQPFYIILNLAVGGNWPGNPDSTTDFDAAVMEVDYVRVYQQDSYDENVSRPEKVVTIREADETGNYINNQNFDVAEDLNDDTDWKFLTAQGGEGAAEIKDGAIYITTKNPGTEDYGIQLVHWDVPMQKGASYKITFDAWGSEDRQAKVAVTAPEVGWIRYFEDTLFDITTEKQSYTFEFDMKDASDPHGRLEFNMGNLKSTGDIYITNVRLEKTTEGEAADDRKTVLGDGNYVYNSKFQEGEARLGEWIFENEAAAKTKEVTPLSDGRRFHCDVNAADSAEAAFAIGQDRLAMVNGKYLLTFLAEGEAGKKVVVSVNGENKEFEMTGKMEEFREEFEFTGADNADVLFFRFPEAGEYYLDNVRIVENVLIKNGSFNADMAGYEVYVDGSANATYVVDSQTEDNAMDFTINATGDQDWKIQLKQNNVKLEKGKTYTLKFDAKASRNRMVRAIMQGGEDKGWPVYSGGNTVKVGPEWETYSLTFTMNEETDPEAFLSICLGAVEGEIIKDQHRVVIDNISLVEE